MRHRPWYLIVAVALAACAQATTSSAQSASTQSGAEAAVQHFLQAVADSNTAKMAELWGTSKGPAAQTHQPSDYERRIVIMQAYLHGADHRILSNATDGSNKDRRVLQVEMSRNGCDKIVPFTVVRLRSGSWLVTAIDLGELGSPGRICGAGNDASPQ